MTLARRIRAAVAAFRRSGSGFDIAGGSGRWPKEQSLWAPTAQVHAAAPVARRRINYIVENSPLASAAVERFVSAAVGDGAVARANVPDPGEAKEIEARFAEFSAACDLEGVNDLCGMTVRVAESWLRDGEAVVRLVPDDGRLQLQMLSCEQIDRTRSLPDMRGGMPMDDQGVRVEGGRVTGYWILPMPPDVVGANIAPAVLVDAADICFVVALKYAGQRRGMAPLAASATRFAELDLLEDALLKKAQVSALMCGFIRDLDGSSGITGDGSPTDPNGLSLEPGTLRHLPGGTTIEFSPTSDQTGAEAITKHMARSACATVAPYMIVAGDWAEANYSSAQAGLQFFRRRIKQFQANHLTAQFLAKVWARWMLMEVLSGRLRAPNFESRPQDYLTARFIWPAFESLDPLKASKARTLDLAARVRSRAEVISSDFGRDPSDVDTEAEADPYVPDPATAAEAAKPEPNDAT